MIPAGPFRGRVGVWHTPNLIGRTRVYLDGVELDDVVDADSVDGWVDVLRRDRNGDLVIVRDDVVSHRLWGCVEILVTV